MGRVRVRVVVAVLVATLAGALTGVTAASAAPDERDIPRTAAPEGMVVSSVSAGAQNTCALRTDSTVACWGGNNFGQSTPTAGTFTSVSVGSVHGCGLRTDATVACWGQSSAIRPAHPQARSPRSAPAHATTAGYAQTPPWPAGAATGTTGPPRRRAPSPR